MQPLHYIESVATLARLSDSTVLMYPADHAPPHFHVKKRDGREALVELSDLSILSGSLAAREIATALAWARVNGALLASKWKELNP